MDQYKRNTIHFKRGDQFMKEYTGYLPMFFMWQEIISFYFLIFFLSSIKNNDLSDHPIFVIIFLHKIKLTMIHEYRFHCIKNS